MQRGILVPQKGGPKAYDVVFFWQRAGRGYDVQSLYEGGGKGTQFVLHIQIAPPHLPHSGTLESLSFDSHTTAPHPRISPRRLSVVSFA